MAASHKSWAEIQRQGGPAFAAPGMTARDWFAGQMWATEAARYDAGSVREYEWSRFFPSGAAGVRREEIIAVLATIAADAMVSRLIDARN